MVQQDSRSRRGGARLGRRSFLGALGAGLALAPLGGLATAGRASADPTVAPQRLVLWPMMNGADPARFWPSTGLASPVLEPLAPWAARTTLVRGLSIASADNHQAIRATFTGQPIAGYDAADPAVRSLDQVVAAHLDAIAPCPVSSVHLGVRPADAYEFYQLYGRSTLFFTETGPVDYEASPVAAYDRLFGGAPASTPPPMVGLDPEAEALSIVSAELDALRVRTAMLPTEDDKLAQHRGALDALVSRRSAATGTPPPSASCSGAIASVEALRATLGGDPRAAYRDDLFSSIFDAQIDVAARTIGCGLSHVVTIQAGSADGNVLVPVDGGLPHHTTSHGDQDAFARVQRWYATKLARLLTALDVPDALDPMGGTVLDNTTVLVMAECLPLSHESVGVPCFYVGSAGGALRTGTTVDATGATNRHLLDAIARAFGVDAGARAHFGGTSLAGVLS